MRDRKAFSGNCGRCTERSVCGGCRARAYAYFGDLQACDPGCARNQKAWDALWQPAAMQAETEK